jgi:hypothetical protein
MKALFCYFNKTWPLLGVLIALSYPTIAQQDENIFRHPTQQPMPESGVHSPKIGLTLYCKNKRHFLQARASLQLRSLWYNPVAIIHLTIKPTKKPKTHTL